MSVADLIDSGNIIDRFDPVTRDESNIVEVTGLGVQNALDNYHTFSAPRLKDDQLREQQLMIEERTGLGLYDLIGEDAREDDIKRFERVDQLLKDRADELVGIPNSAEMLERARETARMSQQDFEEAIKNTGAVQGTVGGFIGSFSGAAVDPINLALLPIGAGAGKNVLQTVLIEAGINAGAEAITQPVIASWQREIGNEYGFTDAVANVGFAALLGGGFAGVVRGTRPAASAAFEFIAKSEAVPAGLRAQVKQLADWAHIRERNPYEDIDGIGHEKHVENINATARAFEQRKSIDDVEIDTQGMRKSFKEQPEVPVARGTEPVRITDPHTAVLADTNKFISSQSDDVLSDADVAAVRDAELTEINRLAELDPEFEINLDAEELRALFPDKQSVRAADIAQMTREDKQLLDAVRVCAVG